MYLSSTRLSNYSVYIFIVSLFYIHTIATVQSGGGAGWTTRDPPPRLFGGVTQDPQYSRIRTFEIFAVFSASPTTTTEVPQAFWRKIMTIIFYRNLKLFLQQLYSTSYKNNHTAKLESLMRIRIILVTKIFTTIFKDLESIGNYLYLLFRKYFHSNSIFKVMGLWKKD